MTEYIEIVHESSESLEQIRGSNPRIDEKINNILRLDSDTVLFYDGRTDENPPDVPKDTTIRVGGSVLEECVQRRVEYLNSLGFQNVVLDEEISFSRHDLKT